MFLQSCKSKCLDSSSFWFFALLFGVVACELKPPFAQVILSGEQSLVELAVVVHYSDSPNLKDMKSRSIRGNPEQDQSNHTLSWTFTMVAQKAQKQGRWFELVDAQGHIIARGFSDISFSRNAGSPQIVNLMAPCELAEAKESSCALSEGGGLGICNSQAQCVESVCGDGLVDTQSEACDDGNEITNDACLNDCTWNVCGDGKLCSYSACANVPQGGIEQCDDGNLENTDACLNICTHALCGDGVTRVDILTDTDVDFEACDKGDENSDAPDALCRTDCSLPRCGDGVKDSDEACDDGNASDTDACRRDCTLAVCGDGIVRTDIIDNTSAGFEACDDGEANSDNGQCLIDCRLAFCGDDKTCSDGNCTDAIDGLEACDDGNERDDDECTNECQKARCGDGLIWVGEEECDDDNTNDADVCRNNCTIAACGDGVKRTDIDDTTHDDYEACDDDNTNDADACRNNCTIAACGDGVRRSDISDTAHDDYEACDDGNPNDTDACRNSCASAFCGDGVRRSDISDVGDVGFEACDDGDGNDTNACTTDCAMARCGDGLTRTDISDTTHIDYEACDDDNDIDADACRNDCSSAICGDGVLRVDITDPSQVDFENCEDQNINPNDGCHECRSVDWLPEVLLGRVNESGVTPFVSPQGVAVDDAGNVFVADGAAGVVWKLNPSTGVIFAVAGSGDALALNCWDLNQNATCDMGSEDSNGDGRCTMQDCSRGDGGLATDAVMEPVDVAVGPDGNLYIADRSGIGETLDEFCWDTTPNPFFGDPCDSPTEDKNGDNACDVFDCNFASSRLRVVSPDGQISTRYEVEYPKRAAHHFISSVAVDQQGLIYVAEGGSSGLRNDVSECTTNGIGGYPTFGIFCVAYSQPFSQSCEESIGQITKCEGSHEENNTGCTTVVGGASFFDEGAAALEGTAPDAGWLCNVDDMAVDTQNNLFFTTSFRWGVYKYEANTAGISLIKGDTTCNRSLCNTHDEGSLLPTSTECTPEQEAALDISDCPLLGPAGLTFLDNDTLLVEELYRNRIVKIETSGGVPSLWLTGAQDLNTAPSNGGVYNSFSRARFGLAGHTTYSAGDAQRLIFSTSPNQGALWQLQATGNKLLGRSDFASEAATQRFDAMKYQTMTVDSKGGLYTIACEPVGINDSRYIVSRTCIGQSGCESPQTVLVAGGRNNQGLASAPRKATEVTLLSTVDGCPEANLFDLGNKFALSYSDQPNHTTVAILGESEQGLGISALFGFSGRHYAPGGMAFLSDNEILFSKLFNLTGSGAVPDKFHVWTAEAGVEPVTLENPGVGVCAGYGQLCSAGCPGNNKCSLGGHGLLRAGNDKIYFIRGHALFALNRVATGQNISWQETLLVGGPAQADFFDSSSASLVRFNQPSSLALAPDGSLLVADTSNHRIRRVDLEGGYAVTTLAGSGVQKNSAEPLAQGDGRNLSLSKLSYPSVLAVHGDTVYMMEKSGANNTNMLGVRYFKYSPEASTTIHTLLASESGYWDGPKSRARLFGPEAIAHIPSLGAHLIADANGTSLRYFDVERSELTTVAGSLYNLDGTSSENEALGAPALAGASGLVFDGAQYVYISEANSHRLRRLDLGATPLSTPEWTLSVWAGPSDPATGLGFQQEDVALENALFNHPMGLALSPGGGELYLADSLNRAVRKIDFNPAPPTVSTLVGSPDFLGLTSLTGMPLSEVKLNRPVDVAMDPCGRFLAVADADANLVYRIDLANDFIERLAGTGQGATLLGATAIGSALNAPSALEYDGAGNLFIATKDSVFLVIPPSDCEAACSDGPHTCSAKDTDIVRQIYGAYPYENAPEGDTQCLSDIHLFETEGNATNALLVDRCLNYLVHLGRCTAGNCKTLANNTQCTNSGACQGVCDLEDSQTCEAAYTCGNGVVENAEFCDDGNSSDDGNGCSAQCLGNSLSSSECISNDACEGVCIERFCESEGLLFESCDLGDTQDCKAPYACAAIAECRLPVGEDCTTSDTCFGVCDLATNGSHKCEAANTCGNGALENSEGCDDGNADDDANGCTQSCKLEDGQPCALVGDTGCVNTCLPTGECGAKVAQGQSCDSSGDCAGFNVCDLGTEGSEVCEVWRVCGNGVVESYGSTVEGCDDGNSSDDGNGCTESCKNLEGYPCSSGSCAPTLVCDTQESNTCEPENQCGNGVKEAVEGCDDGNVASGDGCSDGCLSEENFGCTESIDCVSGYVCDVIDSQSCEPVDFCGNGVREGDEQCDPGVTIRLGCIDCTSEPIYVNQAAPGGNTGASWADALIDLQSALTSPALANLVTPVEIWVAQGTYKPTTTDNKALFFNVPDKVQIYGGFDGTESSKNERNWSTNPTILSGNIGDEGVFTDNSTTVLIFGSVGADTIVDGVIVRDAGINSFTIFTTGSASPIIRHVVVTRNAGIGLYLSGTEGEPLLEQVLVVDNGFSVSSHQDLRGGILVDGAVSIKNSTIAHNFGSGIKSNPNNSEITLTNSLLFNNGLFIPAIPACSTASQLDDLAGSAGLADRASGCQTDPADGSEPPATITWVTVDDVVTTGDLAQCGDTPSGPYPVVVLKPNDPVAGYINDCIDTGDNSVAPASLLDLAGATRIVDGDGDTEGTQEATIDPGAYEAPSP
jgi:cysteine-rich repeat protein